VCWSNQCNIAAMQHDRGTDESSHSKNYFDLLGLKARPRISRDEIHEVCLLSTSASMLAAVCCSSCVRRHPPSVSHAYLERPRQSDMLASSAQLIAAVLDSITRWICQDLRQADCAKQLSDAQSF
jgi:hypothetical protein